MQPPVIVIGAGGHARVVIATLQAAGRVVEACFDDDQTLWGTELLGVPVQGPVEAALSLADREAILGIGSNRARQALVAKLALQWTTAVHPFAWVHESVSMAPGAIVFAGAIAQPEVVLGAHTVLNTSCSVDHECVLEDYSQVSPGAHLAGRVHIEEGVVVGMGASVIQCLTVGAWSVVGAGAVVIRDVPPDVTVVAVPARRMSEQF